MLAPTLIVGLGGAGSKIVSRVSRMVDEKQRKHISFVVFDTDINEMRAIQRDDPHIRAVQISTSTTVGAYLEVDKHARDEWFPVNPILFPKVITEGAGQVRAVSRLAFDTAIRSGRLEQLNKAVQDLYQLEIGREDQALRVMIVGSLAGGTGSGLILPVGLYIKNYLRTHFHQGANVTRGFFLLPEVFYSVIKSESERSNLKSNAYAALREMDAFLMKADSTLDAKYADSVRFEVPRVGGGYEEYSIHPYDYCFLFDAQNTRSSVLPSTNRYFDQAASCIYAMSIGPMNKRSNSSEDNTILQMAKERGRNRYAGAGSSMLIYPVKDVQEYVALDWAKESISKQWLSFDEIFKELDRQKKKKRSAGINMPDIDRGQMYIDAVNGKAKEGDPFAKGIVDACCIFDDLGLNIIGNKWDDYISTLKTKIKNDWESGNELLDGLQEIASAAIGALDSKSKWQTYQETYEAVLKPYRRKVEQRVEESAGTIAYAMFRVPEDKQSLDDQSFRLEAFMRTGEGFIHPNAVRYFLYNVGKALEEESRLADKKARELRNAFSTYESTPFDDPATKDVTETNAQMGDRAESKLDSIRTNDDKMLAKKRLRTYLSEVDTYRSVAVLEKVLEEAKQYVFKITSAYEKFYESFENKVVGLNERMDNIVKKYAHTEGSTIRFVCVSENCFAQMVQKMTYTGAATSIDGELAEEIYQRIRRYSALAEKPNNEDYFGDIFDEGIIGYFKSSVMETHHDRLDMDIIDALNAEAKYELGSDKEKDIMEYVAKVVADTSDLSAPFIEKPSGEEMQTVLACAYNKEIDPRESDKTDNSPRALLIDKYFKSHNGEGDEDVEKNMVMFYQSFYGLRANSLGKFSPKKNSETDKKSEGEYYRAYYDRISELHPDPRVSRAITPHIDRWWHVVSKMPDLDEGSQLAQEWEINAAFFWGIVGDYIGFYDSEGEQRLYRLNPSALGMSYDEDDRLIVSNGTTCNHLYEVLDALSIYPALVKKMRTRVDELTSVDMDRDSVDKVGDGILRRFLDDFRVREYPLTKNGVENSVRSIFDLPFLMKRSVNADMYNEDEIVKQLEVGIAEIERYLYRLCPAKEKTIEMHRILLEQFDKYLEDAAIANSVKDIYHDTLFRRTCDVIARKLEDLGFGKDAQNVKKEFSKLSV